MRELIATSRTCRWAQLRLLDSYSRRKGFTSLAKNLGYFTTVIFKRVEVPIPRVDLKTPGCRHWLLTSEHTGSS